MITISRATLQFESNSFFMLHVSKCKSTNNVIPIRDSVCNDLNQQLSLSCLNLSSNLGLFSILTLFKCMTSIVIICYC